MKEFREPARFLIIRRKTFPLKEDDGVRDIEGIDTVIRLDIGRTDETGDPDDLFLTIDGDGAAAADPEIAVHIDGIDAGGDLCADRSVRSVAPSPLKEFPVPIVAPTSSRVDAPFLAAEASERSLAREVAVRESFEALDDSTTRIVTPSPI
jgi:hypothetical protein